MELKEKVAYIKGMMEGMEFDTATKEGKLLAAVVDVLEEMAKEVTNIDEDVDTLYDEVDAMSEDLEDVELPVRRGRRGRRRGRLRRGVRGGPV
ncbi:MAG: CD1247 N-terminal domain-containing protein [Ruthenibacterium lactatiformans]